MDEEKGCPVLFIDDAEESKEALRALQEAEIDFACTDLTQMNGPADFTPPLLLVNGDFYRTKEQIIAYAVLVRRNGGRDPLGRY